jgi:hypothetical protein
MVPKSPRNKSKVLLLPSQSTFARCKAMNPIHVATPHLKKLIRWWGDAPDSLPLHSSVQTKK